MYIQGLATDVTTVFGRTLAALRAAAGLSQTDFGHLLKMHRTTIARLEIGRTTISVPVQAAVEQLLIDRQALRRHGDLAMLGVRVSERLLARGVTICLDRPPADAKLLYVSAVVEVAREVISAWEDELRASGLLFGDLRDVAPPARFVLTGTRLHTTHARPAEIAQRQARPPAA